MGTQSIKHVSQNLHISEVLCFRSRPNGKLHLIKFVLVLSAVQDADEITAMGYYALNKSTLLTTFGTILSFYFVLFSLQN